MTDSPDQREAKKAARRERMLARRRARYRANRDRILEEMRILYQTNQEYRARQIARARKQDQRKVHLRRYGLTPEDFDRMLKRQHGLCLICWKPFTRTPCVDHDHDSGFVRALFCDNCNIGCGRFFDNPDFLRRAADVMEFFKKHKERILRGEPAVLKEAARLKTALLDLDISHLLPPKNRLPRKRAARKVTSAKSAQPAKAESKKHPQPRRNRRQQGRRHHAARASPRAPSDLPRRALREMTN